MDETDYELIKIAVIETIDYGTEDVKCWMLDEWEGNGYSTEKTKAEREKFAEAVIARLRGPQTKEPISLGLVQDLEANN
jgi:hypothetical protein